MPTTAVLIQDCERLTTSTPLFRLSLAQNIDDLTACQRLRYQVFNCELGEGLALYHSLRDKYLVEPSLRTVPHPASRCTQTRELSPSRTPRLFRAYLEVSGRLCGPPAIDPEFRTIDFLTLVDLHRIPDRVRSRFF